jgi:hypothetical protein
MVRRCSDAGVPRNRVRVFVAQLTSSRVYACVIALVCSYLPAAAATINVPAGGDLQGALNAAQPGDLILLASGATYTGNFKLPLKDGSQFITVRTDAPAGRLPGAGVRITPDHAPLLAKIKSPSTGPALTTAEATHHWRFELVEFQANVKGEGDIIMLGATGSAQALLAQMPHTFVFDRVYLHGDPIVGQKRGIALQSGRTEIINSYFADFKAKGVEAQAICGWNGSGPYLIENNHLEGSGQSLMFGGSDASIHELVPSDIVIRRNLMTKPLNWQGEGWLVKNIFELKNARRVLVEGNTFEHSWKSGQVGFAVLFTPRNQNGKAPWSVVEDVTFRYNVVRHAGGGVNLTGWDDEKSSAQAQRIQIAHNLFYDIDARWGGPGIFLQIGNNPRSVTVEHNTAVQSGSAITVYGKKGGSPWPVDGFVFRDNLLKHNAYGVIGDAQGVGLPTLQTYFTGLTFERNALAGGSASKYPGGNYFPTVEEFNAAFTNSGAEDFTIVAGSPFLRWGSDGGALGADLRRVTEAASAPKPAPTPASPMPPSPTPASPTTPETEDEPREAICRPGFTCEVVDPYAMRARP